MLHRFRVSGSTRAIQGLTLRLIGEAIREGSVDPRVRRTAAGIVAACAQHDELAQLAALHRYVRDEILWVRDPDGVEWLTEAAQTLTEGFEDCDGLTAAFGALARSVGFPIAIVAAGPTAGGPFAHVYPAALVGGRWIAAEVSEHLELGEEIPAGRRERFRVSDESDPKASKLWAESRAGRVGDAGDLEREDHPRRNAWDLSWSLGGAALGLITAPVRDRGWRVLVGFGAGFGAGRAARAVLLRFSA